MINKLLEFVNRQKRFVDEGQKRSIVVKRNIVLSFFLKGVSIAVNILTVPLILKYLNTTEYGIWLTISSLLNWFVFFDIGLGNGLRNKLTISLAEKNYHLSRIYISTSYLIITVIVTFLFIGFVFINPLVKWDLILNSPKYLNHEIYPLIFYVVFLFLLGFIFNLINMILIADQKTSINDLIKVTTNVFFIVLLLILINSTGSSIFKFGIIFMIVQTATVIMATIILFKFYYKKLVPNIKYINLMYTKELMSMGIKYFILQISYVILFTSDNIIITQFLNPSEVTIYNISLKYFNLLFTVFAIFSMPLIPAIYRSLHKK